MELDEFKRLDKRVKELAELVARRKLLEQEILDVIATGFGTWNSVADAMAEVLGISRASFYRRYGHLNPEQGKYRY